MVRQGHLITVVVTFVVAVLVVGCGAGGTGNNDGRGGNRGAAATKEETTAPEVSRPPASTLSYGRREVKGVLSKYSWATTQKNKNNLEVPPKEQTFTAPYTFNLVFRYGSRKRRPPYEVHATAFRLPLHEHSLAVEKKRQFGSFEGPLKVRTSGVETTILTGEPLQSGYHRKEYGSEQYLQSETQYLLWVAVSEPRGQVYYTFRIRLRASMVD